MERFFYFCVLALCLLCTQVSAFSTGLVNLNARPVVHSKFVSGSSLKAVVPQASSSASPLSMKTINVGIIGAGRIGLVHLEALSACPDATPIIISNPTVSKAEAAAKQYNVPKWTGDAMEVITNPDVDAVWICSPSQYHADQIKACAANGKHVFCEKPVATDVPETIEAINACKTANVKLMTALQRRFDPNFARVKEAIVRGQVGDPIQVKLTSRDPSPPPFEYVKGGGGIFKDMAVHDLDMSRFLMGCEPEEILAVGSCMIDDAILELEGPEAYDTATIVIKYQGGATATIDVCRQAPYGYDQRAEVLGQKGMCATDNMYPNTARLYLADYTGNADMPFDFFMSRYKEAYIQETKAFVDCLANDTPSPCTGEDGLIALIMAIAAGKSAAEGRWVKFSELPVVKCDPSGQQCELVDPLTALKTGEGELVGSWVETALTGVQDPVLSGDTKEKSWFEQVFKL
uniref:Gfo/Idh/MocA-like oxidoreductase N-terminal domain-containing protein n=1 Tax=Heterosigma akashiwo TaxID=2829 RepID=A0A6V1RSK2_HETAK